MIETFLFFHSKNFQVFNYFLQSEKKNWQKNEKFWQINNLQNYKFVILFTS